ncbi:HD domain-containing protein [Roseococcus pinisoli]|uniref:Bifunctional (P)ppGpp synthetase/guanosine-3',5'-bis(Diphosphate) 3'-pyrophosphohydrolase n=1 Tax=Roseococcus pinisoli TaxID=2835040 RepID=A0ABS5QF09_9PROT|nr:HD domain-containing protein [Roseococcus pinisoli]MBS7812277.1 bifunctional (p)ppGpp synthetase/guanosine-3',5'-bis(diphosphate) 3'-pyrophosphohydrolase [Roseococcus pinisoli]
MRKLLFRRTESADFAIDFADRAHRYQNRKYSGEPYVFHLIEVHNIVTGYTDDPVTLQAALLHDVVEDTPVEHQAIQAIFGHEVADVVWELTDQFTGPEHGNRAARKAREAARLGNCSGRAHTIKIADLCSNTRSIVLHDPKFAPVYLNEKQQLLPILTKAPPLMRAWAADKLAQVVASGTWVSTTAKEG